MAIKSKKNTKISARYIAKSAFNTAKKLFKIWKISKMFEIFGECA